MNKKVISAVLASAMALSTLGTSVFAADKNITAAGATTYKVSATLAAPEIKVTIPGAVSAVVNPYGVSFEMKGQTYGATGLASGIYTIKNNTTASAVQVNVTATLTVPTTSSKDADGKTVKTPTIKVLTTDAKDYSKLKEKSIYAVVAGDASETNLPVSTKETDIPKLQLFDEGETTAPETVVTVPFVDTTVMDKADIAKLPAKGLIIIPKGTKADDKGTDDKDDDVEATFGYGQFAIGGDITPNSVVTWTSADKIAINLILDIGPCADDAEL